MTSIEPKTYVINLDKRPHRRWREVIQDHKKHFKAVVEEIDNILLSAGFLGKIAKATCGLFNAFDSIKHKKELTGISSYSGVPMDKLILMQICYEMFAACTSTVIKTKNGNIHFRTMDWEMDFLKDLTINVVFTKNNKVLFKAVTWAGYVGIVTGLNSTYSMALNFRASDGTLFGNVMRAMRMKWPVGYLMRDILEGDVSFKTAYKTLCTYRLISPCYITLCSVKGESYVIVRDNDRTVKVRDTKGTNFIVQTNCDDVNDKYDRSDIMWSRDRYRKVEKIMESFNTDVDVKTMTDSDMNDILDIFDVKPITNDYTIYASLMIPRGMKMVSLIKNA